MRGWDIRNGRFLIQTSGERRPRHLRLFRRRPPQPRSIQPAGGLGDNLRNGGRISYAGELPQWAEMTCSRSTLEVHRRADSGCSCSSRGGETLPEAGKPYAEKLMLRQEAGKSRKQQRTIGQLPADLAALGYGCSPRVRGVLSRCA